MDGQAPARSNARVATRRAPRGRGGPGWAGRYRGAACCPCHGPGPIRRAGTGGFAHGWGLCPPAVSCPGSDGGSARAASPSMPGRLCARIRRARSDRACGRAKIPLRSSIAVGTPSSSGSADGVLSAGMVTGHARGRHRFAGAAAYRAARYSAQGCTPEFGTTGAARLRAGLGLPATPRAWPSAEGVASASGTLGRRASRPRALMATAATFT